MNFLSGYKDLNFPVFLVCVYKACEQKKIKLLKFACAIETIIPPWMKEAHLSGYKDLNFPVFLVCVYKACEQKKIKLLKFACAIETIIPPWMKEAHLICCFQNL